jgi:hypothetical protein
LCKPAVMAGAWKVATPELPAVALPKRVAPSKKVTVPVGVPEVAETVAVRLTAWVVVAGFGETISEVVVEVAAGALTVSTAVDETDALRVVFPA